ncbi:hypothetical protein ACTXT7_000380 [Hymenolepis weldensis]
MPSNAVTENSRHLRATLDLTRKDLASGRLEDVGNVSSSMSRRDDWHLFRRLCAKAHNKGGLPVTAVIEVLSQMYLVNISVDKLRPHFP